MPFISINRVAYPGKTDREIAKAEIVKLSDGYRYFAVVGIRRFGLGKSAGKKLLSH